MDAEVPQGANSTKQDRKEKNWWFMIPGFSINAKVLKTRCMIRTRLDYGEADLCTNSFQIISN